MDRLAPMQRPMGKNAGTQQWRDLAFFHWAVDPLILRRLVPPELELDLWQGQAFVSIIPFAMRAVKPAWLPGLFAANFLEANLRTYVHNAGKDPGVYFFSLDAASRIAAWVGRVLFGLPYNYANIQSSTSGGDVSYLSERRNHSNARLFANYRIGAELGVANADTIEHFLLERYLFYVKRSGELRLGRVHHKPYPIAQLTVTELQENLFAEAGLHATNAMPDLAHYSTGVDIEFFPLESISK